MSALLDPVRLTATVGVGGLAVAFGVAGVLL